MKNAIKVFGIIAALAVMGFSMAGCLSFGAPLPFPQTGTWSVIWSDASGDMPGNMVIENVNGNSFTGYFDWYWNETEYAGRETFTGSFDSSVGIGSATIIGSVAIKGNAITDIGVRRLGLSLVTGDYPGKVDRNTLNITGIAGTKWQAVYGEIFSPGTSASGTITKELPPTLEGPWAYGGRHYVFTGDNFEYLNNDGTLRVKGTFTCTETDITFNTTHRLGGLWNAPEWEPITDFFLTRLPYADKKPVPYSFGVEGNEFGGTRQTLTISEEIFYRYGPSE